MADLSPYADLLPPLVAELAETIGLAPALALVEWKWGSRYHVPEKLPTEPTHPLLTRLGADAAAELVKHWGGLRIDIPKCAAALRAVRDERIRAARAGGMSEAEACRQFGLAPRRVRQITSEGREEGQQLSFW